MPTKAPFLNASNDDCAALVSKNLELERKMTSLQHDYEISVDDCAATHKALEAFEKEKRIVNEEVVSDDLKKVTTILDENHALRVENMLLKETISENDEKQIEFNETIHELSMKLEKAKKELLESFADHNETKKIMEVEKAAIIEETEKLKDEDSHNKKALKKKEAELIAEKKKSKDLNENLCIAEAQLENQKHAQNKILYNVETNNNFEVLEKSERAAESTAHVEASEDENNVENVEIDHSNYKEHLLQFLETFKETPAGEFTYQQAALKMLNFGHNIFHISLLDVGHYNPKLKAFLKQNRQSIEKDSKELIMKFGESLGKGSFKMLSCLA